MLYVHPWEFDPGQPRLITKPFHRFRHYVGLERAAAKVGALLHEFRFTTIAAVFPPVRPSAVVRAPRVA
jgi:hypothetical protein